MKKFSGIILLVFFISAVLHNASFAQKYAITNAKIVTVSGQTIENGTIVIDGGRISAVGRSVSIPSDAQRIDGTGHHVYPGMIGTNSAVGLNDVSGVWQTTDQTESGEFNTFMRASQAVNPQGKLINIHRYNGITASIATPRAAGGVIGGQEFLMNLDGWTVDEMGVKDPASIQLSYPGSPGSGRRGGRPGGNQENARERTERQMAELKDILARTRLYIKAKEEFEAGSRQTPPDKDLSLEPLIPVLKREIPFTVTVNGVSKMREAMKFAKEENVKVVFAGARDAYKIAGELAENNVPILYEETLRLPTVSEPYDLYYTIPKLLVEAGVKFAFSISSQANLRNLPFMAGMCVPYGLSKEDALKAVTLYPAQMYGVDDIMGSLEVGKMANVVVTNGDLLEPSTKVTHEFIRGVMVDLTASQDYQLYEKHRARKKKN